MSNLQRIEKVLLFLTLLFLPTQLGKHFWPPFAFVYSLPVDYLSPTLYFWDLLVLMLLIIFVISGKGINKPALNIFFFFILTQSLSIFSSVNISAGLVRMGQYLIAGLFGVYLASLNFSKNKPLIFWALLLSVLGEGILATAQFIKGGTLGFWLLGERTFSISTPGIAKFDFYGVQFLRPYATFPHPNVLAAFLLISVMMLSALRGYRKALTAGALVFFAGLVVLLTASRSVILAGFIAAAILLKNKGRMVLLLVTLILLPLLYTRFSSVWNFDQFTLIRREELSLIALSLWSKSPVLGVGLNNFIVATSDLLLSGPSRFLQPVHNIFLLALSEAGLIGLTGLISLIGFPVFMLFKLNPKPYPLNPALLVWGIIIFLGMFDHYFLTLPQGYRLLFLVWGLSFSLVDTRGSTLK